MTIMTNQEFARLWSAKMHIAKADKKMRQIAEQIENWGWQIAPIVY